jgi:hypothetical protein
LNEKSQSFKRRTFLKIKNKEQFCFYWIFKQKNS